MRTLELLGSPTTEQLHLIETITPVWEKAGDLLGLRYNRVKIIREDHIGRGMEACCRTMFEYWLSDRHTEYCYDQSWEGMCQLLEALEMSEVAESLRLIVF